MRSSISITVLHAFTVTHNNMIYTKPKIMKELANNSFQKTGYILPFYKKHPTMKHSIRLTLFLIALVYIT